MRWVLCIIPPLAIATTKRPGQVVISVILTLLFYIPGVIHALIIVGSYQGDKREQRIMAAVGASGEAATTKEPISAPPKSRAEFKQQVYEENKGAEFRWLRPMWEQDYNNPKTRKFLLAVKIIFGITAAMILIIVATFIMAQFS